LRRSEERSRRLEPREDKIENGSALDLLHSLQNNERENKNRTVGIDSK
jgi:hypothetical protein